jgi:rhomboid protease GluP
MSLQRCATCGQEFERNFDDPYSSFNCPACVQQHAQAIRASSASGPNTLSPTAFPVTIGLIAASVLVFVVMVLRGVSAINPTPQQAIAFGADFGPYTLGGQWWRLFTSMFVHFGFIHLGLNMWCLWNLGRAAERLLGRFSYLLAYLASGIFGSIASVYWHPQAAGAGASGAIFGLAGVLVSFVKLKKTPAHLQINSKMLGSLGTFILYNLAFGALPGISNAAHIGGLVIGLAVGALLPSASADESSRRTRLSFVVAICAVALIASAIATKRLRAGVSELAAIQRLIAAKRTEEALVQLQELTAREPNFAPAQSLLASVYFQQTRYPEAVTALQKAIDADPANTTYQQQLGGAYLSLGEFDQAIAFYQKLVSQHSTDSRTYLGLGYANVGLKQYDPAILAFRKAADLDAKSPGPLHALGQAQLHAARYADAQQTYRRLLAQFPNDTRAQAALDFATHQIR